MGLWDNAVGGERGGGRSENLVGLSQSGLGGGRGRSERLVGIDRWTATPTADIYGMFFDVNTINFSFRRFGPHRCCAYNMAVHCPF